MASPNSNNPWPQFCGGNSSLWEETGKPREGAFCRVDFVNFLIHASSSVALSLLLVTVRCRWFPVSKDLIYFRRYPLHSVQWLCMLAVFLFNLGSIAEGFLTDATYQSNVLGEVYPTQPHLYVPSICGLVMTSLAMVYYHHMEAWRLPHMVWFLLVYWSLVLAGQILNLLALIDVGAASIFVLRFDVCVINMLASFGLFLLELNVIRVKLCCAKRSLYEIGVRDPPKDMKFTIEFASFISEYTFWWMDWIFKLGYKRPIEKDDLGCLPESHSASYLHSKFREAFRKEQRRAEINNCKLNIWRVYWEVHGWRLTLTLIMKLAADMCALVGPLALLNIITWVERVQNGTEIAVDPHLSTVAEMFENGVVLVFVIFISLCFKAVLMHNFEQWSAMVGIDLRSAIQTMVFEKSLSLSTSVTSTGEMSTGQITNHMSVDAMNIFYMCQYVLWAVSLPIQVIIIIGLLIMQLGISAILGVAIFACAVPVQFVITNYMAKKEKKSLALADDRLKMTNEVLQGIKLLKMYGWEELFGSRIDEIRKSEIWTITKMMTSWGVLSSVTDAIPLLVTLVSFGTLGPLTGKAVTPDLAFSSTALFNCLRMCFYLVPMSIFTTVNGMISSRRIKAFLCASEVTITAMDSIKVRRPFPKTRRNGRANSAVTQATDENETYFSDGDVEVPLLKTKTDRFKSSNSSLQSTTHETDTPSSYGALNKHFSTESGKGLRDDVAIKISNGSFLWEADRALPVLSRINATIPAGKVTMVVGPVGSGKSSLLSAILEEMFLLAGSMQINGGRQSIAYAGQKAWLMNTTLKENILFGRPYYPKRYRRVIEACALQSDIDILPAGDQTEIGEKGINVSGGQKQRISVARAVYSGRDIVLLDDPLSALDVHVGEHLFQHGVMGILRRKKKTTILVTHQLQYLAHADKIILMKDCKIAEEGTFDDISTADPDLYNGYQKAVQKMTEESETSDAEFRRQEITHIRKQIPRRTRGENDGKLETCDEKGRLMATEEMERGSIAWGVYFFYAKYITVPAVLLIFILFPLQAAVNAGAAVWLSKWTEAEATAANETDTVYYIQIYAAISTVGIFVSFFANMTLIMSFLLAARKIFNSMLHTIIHMNMRFFDTTPVGRIMNRFAADLHIIDTKIFVSYQWVLFDVSVAATAVILNTIINPVFLAIVVPLLFVYFIVRKIFMTTSRVFQRLDSVYKSPVFTLFSETLGGLSTIRAYRKHQSFFDKIIDRVSTNNTTFMYVQTSIRWLGVRMDFIGAIVVLAAGLTSVLGAIGGGANGSEVGLGLSYALQISAYFQFIVRFMAEAEMYMNAVERVKHYTSLATDSCEGIEPPPDWPTRGAISLEDISVRYAEELDPVLKNVSVHIDAGKKVGICGRTGSGKSSLTLALFRIIDTFKGRIVIDGIDIARVPLTTLRRRLAIIPQDPVLFEGTIRMNLDPENRRTEQELWDALEIAQLKELVLEMEGGVDSQVAEGGETFSVGQRQLFCLARAFLRNAPILIMDEATASIDLETDKILQRVVTESFANKTVLVIAHRVATILNSDTILTFSQGEVVEHDTPGNLMLEPDSVFASLVHNDQ